MAESAGSLDQERIPPQDLDAEQAVLGAMLLGGDATSRVAELLIPDDFYRDSHRRICAACLALFDKGEPVDIVSVAAELKAQDKLEDSGSFDYLDRLVRATPYAANAERYAQIVKDKAILRNLLFTAQRIATSCYDPTTSATEALDQAEAAILKLAQSRAGREFVHIRPIAYEVYDEAEKKFMHGGEQSGVPTGFTEFDRYTAGLQKGDLVILAARPSIGKTSLAVCMAMNAALKGTPTALFSLEMSKEQLVSGMICTQAQVNLARWRSGKFRSEDWTAISDALNHLVGAPIYIDDSPALSPTEMRARARRVQAEHGLGLVIVDYLQLMRGSTKTDNRVAEISEITRSLKGLAKELEVPVMALSQLSRAVEQRQDKRPMLSDLRESGQIEADADVVMFLYRSKYYDQQKGSEEEDRRDALDDEAEAEFVELTIAKQRNGPTGTVHLGFRRQFKKFATWDGPPPEYARDRPGSGGRGRDRES